MRSRRARALELVIMYLVCVALVSSVWWLTGVLGESDGWRFAWCVLLVFRWSTNPKLTFLSSDPPREKT